MLKIAFFFSIKHSFFVEHSSNMPKNYYKINKFQKLSSPHNKKRTLIYCCGFVNIGTKICIDYLLLNYNISDAREIFIFDKKSRDFS